MKRWLLLSSLSLFACPITVIEPGEGEGDTSEGEGDPSEGERDPNEGEGDIGEGEGDIGEGEGDIGEGEGEPTPVVQLNGTTWTPNRDNNGEVLLTDFAQLPLNSWVTVEGDANQLRDIEPMPPHPSGYGPTGFAQIVSAWGGAAWDDDHHRMILSGGGHADSSAAETGIFTLDAATMQFSLTVARQPLDSALHVVDGVLVEGEGYPGGNNFPLATGVPGSNHTYEGLVWLPTETMTAIGLGSPARGGMYYPGNASSVVNLDTGAYSKLHWITSYYDVSYVTAVRWQNTIILPLGSFYFRRMDLAGHEQTAWQTSGFDPDPTTDSHMELLPSTTTNTNFVQGGRLFCDLPQRGEMISFAAQTTRVRYGAAQDAGDDDWTAHHDAITLTGRGAVDFSADNFVDVAGSLLSQGGGHYLHSTGEVFVAPNLAGREIYRVTGIDSNDWSVEPIVGTALLTSSQNSTYGRFVVFERGGVKVAMRISSVDNPIEVMRVQ
jgi:hypothetical protein